MCSFTSSKPKPQPAPAPVYVPPTIQQPVYTPPPPVPAAPVPSAPIPYYDSASDPVTNEKNTNNISRAKVGRAALKINLVNSGDESSGSYLNTTN